METLNSLLFTVAIKKRSRVAGVIITQHVENLPAGKSTPDFIRKPMATTVQEGKYQARKVKHACLYHCCNADPSLDFQVKKHFSEQW